MPEGVVIGGWQFIIPAYLITAVVLVGYVWSLLARCHRLEQDEVHDE